MHQSLAALTDNLDWIREAPGDDGTVRLLVRRPAEDERELLSEMKLDLEEGAVGDYWHGMLNAPSEDDRSDAQSQVTLMNWRAVSVIADSDERRALAGDQLYVDLDLSVENLPVGSRLRVGSAILEVNDNPHRGCVKFAQRFGKDALRFVNIGSGRELRLRGIHADVVHAGVVRVGDTVHVERPDG